jgi:hypothetical protein
MDAERLARVLSKDGVRELDAVPPAVVIGGGDLGTFACEQPGESPIPGGDLKTGVAPDHRRQRLDQAFGVETVDALRLDERHQESPLPEKRPDEAEPEQRHRFALEIVCEEELLRDPSVDQVEADPACRDAGSGGEVQLLERRGGHLTSDLRGEHRIRSWLAARMTGRGRRRLGHGDGVGLELFAIAPVDELLELALNRIPLREVRLAKFCERRSFFQPRADFVGSSGRHEVSWI